MKCQIFIDILLLIGVVYLFSMCSSGKVDKNYTITHYVDTIYGNVILTTVCESTINANISVSTLNIDNTDNN